MEANARERRGKTNTNCSRSVLHLTVAGRQHFLAACRDQSVGVTRTNSQSATGHRGIRLAGWLAGSACRYVL